MSGPRFDVSPHDVVVTHRVIRWLGIRSPVAHKSSVDGLRSGPLPSIEVGVGNASDSMSNYVTRKHIEAPRKDTGPSPKVDEVWVWVGAHVCALESGLRPLPNNAEGPF